MSKKANDWESPVSNVVPYLQWTELRNGEINTWRTGRHNHASYELHIILSGQCSLFVNNVEVLLQAGQGIIVAPEVFHAPNNVIQPFSRFSATFFPNEEQISLLIADQAAYTVFPAGNNIKDLCFEILEEINKEDGLFHKELLANQFAQLMLRVLRTVMETTSDTRTTTPHAKQLEDMSVIDVFFVRTPPKLRTKENLAKLLHCSQRQVLRKIYALYGVSFQKKANAFPT